jgi:hypothetical protein
MEYNLNILANGRQPKKKIIQPKNNQNYYNGCGTTAGNLITSYFHIHCYQKVSSAYYLNLGSLHWKP